MLKNIDPLLNADVLQALRAMGHGDVVVMSDTNFPSDSVANSTVLGRLLRIDAPGPRVAEAILSVLPLDEFVPDPAMSMQVQDSPDEIPEVQKEVQQVVTDHGGGTLRPVDRFEFYDLARKSYCVITTNERRFYGCFMFHKGVIAPQE